MNNNTIQAAAVEVQRRTPEALQRTEEPYAGLLPHVEVKLKAISGCDRRPEARLLDQAANPNGWSPSRYSVGFLIRQMAADQGE